MHVIWASDTTNYYIINTPETCPYTRLLTVAQNEGTRLLWVEGSTLEGCQDTCDITNGCKSLTYCPGRPCYLYDKEITTSEPQRANGNCFTSYQSCEKGNFSIINSVPFTTS